MLNILHAPLRTLANKIAPLMIVIDCGGKGQCGPNTLAYLLGLAGIVILDGPQLRTAVVEYVKDAGNLRKKTNCLHGNDTPYTIEELILDCFAGWPTRGAKQRVTVENWAKAIGKPATWTDLAFLHCVADLYQVSIDVLAVNDLSAVWRFGCLQPCENIPAKAKLAVGMWWNRHLVALAIAEDAPPLAQAAGTSRTVIDVAARPAQPAQPTSSQRLIEQHELERGVDDSIQSARVSGGPEAFDATVALSLISARADARMHEHWRDSDAQQLLLALQESRRVAHLQNKGMPDAVFGSAGGHGVLQQAVARHGRSIVSVPGDDSCAFHAILDAMRRVDATRVESLTAAMLRQQVVEELKRPDNLSSEWIAPGTPSAHRERTLRHTLTQAAAVMGYHSLSHWFERMTLRHTWGDGNTLLGAALLLNVRINVIMDDLRMPLLEIAVPTSMGADKQPTATIWLGLYADRHFVSTKLNTPQAPQPQPDLGDLDLDAENSDLDLDQFERENATDEVLLQAAEPSLTSSREAHSPHAPGEPLAVAAPPPMPAERRGSSASKILPRKAALTTSAQVATLLQGETPPTVLVACEFSGAVRTALEAEGIIALSVDYRECDVGGLHFQGDIRDVIGLACWHRVYMFPPCFQQLRADKDCLPLKIADGRAFWGCAFVIWCIACNHADAVIVEQPDTIVHDYLDLSAFSDVCVTEFRTSAFGDSHDKFVRITLRNAQLETPRFRPAQRGSKPPNAHLRHANPDARDRARSTLVPMPKTCAALARVVLPHASVTPIDYDALITAFARAWHSDGHPVPRGFRTPDARPPSLEARVYQQLRGRGDGRTVDAVVPMAAVDSLTAEERCIVVHGLAAPDDLVPALELGDVNRPVRRSRARRVARRTPTRPNPKSQSETGTKTSVDTPPLMPEQTIDIRDATQAASVLIFVSMLVQPLVLAHADGFTTAGLVLPAQTKRSQSMAAIQALCTAIATTTAYMAFMIGEYANGTRVFAAPVDYSPPAELIVRTPAERHRKLSCGSAFIWCTLAALASTPIADAGARAILGCEMFIKPVETLTDARLSTESASFKFGVEQARSAICRPILNTEASPPAWRALARMAEGDSLLAQGLHTAVAAGRTLLQGWAERISPLTIGDVPPHLLSNLPDFSDKKLDTVPLSAQVQPLTTPWLPLPPRQEPADERAPTCPKNALEMLTEGGRKRLDLWLKATRNDLRAIRNGLAIGVHPEHIKRARPRPIAIGQTEFKPWARGRVWDCTFEKTECCVVADFHAPILENLNRTELKRRLAHHPDQTLVAHLLEGARLDADVELQLVLVPHLLSIANGYESVAKELKRLEQAGWYKSFSQIPYIPMYFNGNGAVPRKLECRWRRCVEGGGPRQCTRDASGLQAISINDASHIRYMPMHFKTDERPEFRAWLRARGLPPEIEELPEEGGAVRTSKWPKERKPQLAWAMRDMAVFGRAAYLTAQAVYTAGDDAKDYFSQMPMAASELSKVGVIFLDESSGAEPQLRFISERVLGFGTHGASNIAQRLSDAIMIMYYEDMDAAEEAEGWARSPAERAWVEGRLDLMRRRGAACHHIRRFSLRPEDVPPEIAAPMSVSEIPKGYVCPELRLFSGYMYTDDNELLFVGVARTLRGLEIWKCLVTKINLLMAIEEKRSLGTWCLWLGVLLISGLGVVATPRAKILRAGEAIARTLRGEADFQTYRSLCGLLEHLRAVILRGRNVMHGLYEPHGAEGASRDGPSALVDCNELMRKQLERWRKLLVQACGVSVKRALLREELDVQPSITFDLTSDACYSDVDVAGIAGFMHGLYWYFAVPDEDYEVVNIPLLEFLGVCFNILIFHSHLEGLGDGARVMLRTDALTTARTLPEESMHSVSLVEAFQWLVEQEEWQQIAPRTAVQHIFGDCNALSDLASRAKWAEFHRLCAQLGIKPQETPVTKKCEALYQHVVQRLRQRPSLHSTALELGVANNGASAQTPFAQAAPSQELRESVAAVIAQHAEALQKRYKYLLRTYLFIAYVRGRKVRDFEISSRQHADACKREEDERLTYPLEDICEDLRVVMHRSMPKNMPASIRHGYALTEQRTEHIFPRIRCKCTALQDEIAALGRRAAWLRGAICSTQHKLGDMAHLCWALNLPRARPGHYHWQLEALARRPLDIADRGHGPPERRRRWHDLQPCQKRIVRKQVLELSLPRVTRLPHSLVTGASSGPRASDDQIIKHVVINVAKRLVDFDAHVSLGYYYFKDGFTKRVVLHSLSWLMPRPEEPEWEYCNSGSYSRFIKLGWDYLVREPAWPEGAKALVAHLPLRCRPDESHIASFAYIPAELAPYFYVYQPDIPHFNAFTDDIILVLSNLIKLDPWRGNDSQALTDHEVLTGEEPEPTAEMVATAKPRELRYYYGGPPPDPLASPPEAQAHLHATAVELGVANNGASAQTPFSQATCPGQSDGQQLKAPDAGTRESVVALMASRAEVMQRRYRRLLRNYIFMLYARGRKAYEFRQSYGHHLWDCADEEAWDGDVPLEHICHDGVSVDIVQATPNDMTFDIRRNYHATDRDTRQPFAMLRCRCTRLRAEIAALGRRVTALERLLIKTQKELGAMVRFCWLLSSHPWHPGHYHWHLEQERHPAMSGHWPWQLVPPRNKRIVRKEALERSLPDAQPVPWHIRSGTSSHDEASNEMIRNFVIVEIAKQLTDYDMSMGHIYFKDDFTKKVILGALSGARGAQGPLPSEMSGTDHGTGCYARFVKLGWDFRTGEPPWPRLAKAAVAHMGWRCRPVESRAAQPLPPPVPPLPYIQILGPLVPLPSFDMSGFNVVQTPVSVTTPNLSGLTPGIVQLTEDEGRDESTVPPPAPSPAPPVSPPEVQPHLHATAVELGVANNGASAQTPFSQASPSRSPSAGQLLRDRAAAPCQLSEIGRLVPASPPRGGKAKAEPAESPSASEILRQRASVEAEAKPRSPTAAGPAGHGSTRPRQMLGSMSFPAAPPKRAKQETSLLEAGKKYAQARMLAFTEGGEPGMALRADIASLMPVADAMEELIEHGVNANTWDKDSRAWEFWVVICNAHGCSPMRTAAEARDYPERNAHLLAALMFYAFSVCKPRDRTRKFIKPRSALAYPLAIIRIFARWSVPLPSYKMLKAALQGLSRMYVNFHGPYSLAPHRSEPMKFSTVRKLNEIPSGAKVGSTTWDYEAHDVFMFRRLNRVMIVTAFRLGEIVEHTSREIMYITFESLVWSIGGVMVAEPTEEQFRAMRSGIDRAHLAPSRSKPDQWGEIHCPFAAVLTYDENDPINAAAALRDIELASKVTGAARATTPLFHDANKKPYTHHYLHHMLRMALAYLYGQAVASLYSWHSYRSGLATALHAAGVDDAMIQLICRWMCPESLHVYRRMGVAEHERHITKAMKANVDLIQSTNVPVVFADQGYAEMVDEVANPRGKSAQKAYEDALKAALDPYGRDQEGGPAPSVQPRQGQSSQERPSTSTEHSRAETAGGAETTAEKTTAPAQELGEAADPSLKVGTQVAVMRETWPGHACKEFGGKAWLATVTARSKNAATVRFTNARSRDGRIYGVCKLQLNVLRLLA